MKKHALLAVLMVLVLALAACGKESAPTLDFGDCAQYGKFGDTVVKEDGEEELLDPTSLDENNEDTANKNAGKSVAPIETTSLAKDGSVTISWEAVLGATSYDIYRSTSQDGKYSEVGSSKTTSYTDKNAQTGKKYFYKVVAIFPQSSQTAGSSGSQGSTGKQTGSTTTRPSTPGFVGSSLKFINGNNKETLLSSTNNNAYIVKIRSEYSKRGLSMPDGRLVYVAITGDKYRHVFQFSSTNTWNDTTLEQVHIFVDDSNYFSFFTMNNGSEAYMNAKKEAQSKWDATQAKNEPDPKKRMSYSEMQDLLLAIARDENFRILHGKSFS